MAPTIREYVAADLRPVVELSLDAWAPVFDSTRNVLGDELFVRMHGNDWRKYQQDAVQAVLADPAVHAWVSEVEAAVSGFVAVRIHEDERRMGEISMIAVSPTHQRSGHGRALIAFATDWMREQGVPVAMIATGGDPGHAPARAAYDDAGYTLLPSAQYFKAL